MDKTVWLVCTMDTKREEGLFLKARLQSRGLKVIIADVSAAAPSGCEADVSNADIAAAAGCSADELFKATRRMDAISRLSEGLRLTAVKAQREGWLDGIMAIGGSGGMSLASDAICALPLGVAKLMVTTVASGNMRPYIGGKDVMVLNPVADLAGLNAISRRMLTMAADAMYGMLSGEADDTPSRPAVAITAFGSTDPCVHHCRELLSERGYDTVVFHARGVSGGTVMEELAADGHFRGILDVTTTEISDLIAGGVYPAETTRLDYLGSLPAVVSAGALDMVNFGARETVPQKYDGRCFVKHGVATTLMRSSSDELVKAAEFIAGKVNGRGKTAFIIPARGFSSYDAEGHDFFDPAADAAFINAAKQLCPACETMDMHLNDAGFAELAVNKLIAMMEEEK